MSNETKWISVEERLPDEDGWYLVTKILRRKPLITSVTVEYWGYGWERDYDYEDCQNRVILQQARRENNGYI